MLTAGRVCPPHRRRVWGALSPEPVRTVIRSAAWIAAALALAGSAGAAPAAPTDRGDPRGRAWEFVPLGPEGADLVSIVPLPDRGWLAQAARGQLLCWAPYDSALGGGAWERIPVCTEGVVHLIARVQSGAGEPLIVVLTSSGELLRWAPPGTAGERVCPPGSAGSGSSSFDGEFPGPVDGADAGGSGKAAGGSLLPWVSVPEDRALSVVSILAGDSGPRAPGLLLALRDGTFYGVQAGGRLERWQAQFHDPNPKSIAASSPASEQAASPAFDQAARRAVDQEASPALNQASSPAPAAERAGEPPRIRLRWAGHLPGEPGAIYAITEWEGLYLSRDGGRLFAPVADGLPKGVRCLARAPDGGVLAGCTEGLFRCTGGGAVWQSCSEQFAVGESDRCEFRALLPVDDSGGRLLARTALGKILSSDDCGRTWHQTLGDVPLRVRAMAWDPDSRETLLATSRGALLSTDGGTSWEWRNQGLRLAGVQAIALGRDGQELFIGTDLGFFARSGVRGEWLPQLPCSAPALQSESRGPDGSAPELGAEVEITGGQDLMTWQRLSDRVLAIDLWESPAGPRLLCLGTASGPAVCAWDGTTGACGWDAGGPMEMATSILALPGGAVCAAGGVASESWAAWRGAEGAWTPVELPGDVLATLDPDGPPGALVSWISEADGQVMLAGGGLARLARWSAYEPAGARDAARDEPLSLAAPPGRRILCVAAAHGDLWAGTDSGLWRLRDGRSWEHLSFGAERVVRITLAKDCPGRAVCRVAGGVYLTEDDGRSWQTVPVPERLHVQSLALDQAGMRLYLGTQFGLFVVALDPSAGAAGGSLATASVLPLEAHPNPFRAQVVVRGLLTGVEPSSPRGATWGVEGAGADGTTWLGDGATGSGEGPELIIVNVHGQLVRRIPARALSAGVGDTRFVEWQWDGRDERGQAAPKGIYLVSARVGNAGYRGKVIKLR